MDKISVTMCAYNAQATIGKAISSVLAQQLSDGEQQFDLELIIVDDGSVDDTLKIIMNYAEKDKRVVFYHQENQGLSCAREKSLEFVTGNYIAFCDSDDWVDPDWLISMYSYAKEYNADIVRFRALIDGTQTKYNPSEVLVWDRMEAINRFFVHKEINAMLMMELIKREVFDGVHFNTSLRYWEDQSVALQLLNRATKIVKVNDAKYHYFVNSSGLSNGKTNLKRVRDSIDVMNFEVDFCKKELNSSLLSSAISFRNGWLLSELKCMYKCGLYEEPLSSEIQSIIRSNPFLTLKSVSGFGQKVFAVCALLNLSFAKLLVRTVIRR